MRKLTLLRRPSVLAFAAIAVLAGASDPTEARQRTTLEFALERCNDRIARYANTPRGRLQEFPTRWDVRSNYRQCVHGYAGRYPARVPDFAPDGFFRLNTILRRAGGRS